MRLTKLGHSCVRLEKDGVTLVIDPGGWSDAPGALSGASAVLITHEHPDHLDADAVRAALARDPALELWSNASIAGQFRDFGAQVHRDIPVIPNTGFAVDGEVFHPGDSLTVPEDRVPTLLLPIIAPWLKTAEMIDYAREVAPQRAYAIHDAILNANGIRLMQQMMHVAAQPSASSFSRLEPGTVVEL